MKLKKIFSAILAAAVAVSAVTFSSFTTFAVDGEELSGTCGENATWFINSDDILVISGTGNVDSHSGWYAYQDDIKEVVIEEGITSTGDSLFTYCKNVEKIVFPSSLETLGHCLSSRLSYLTDVWIFSKTLENKFSGNSGIYPQPGSITKWHVYEGSATEASIRAGLKCTDADFEYITENDSFPEITNREPLVLAAETETSGPAGIKSSWSWDAETKTLTFSGSGAITITSGFKKYSSVVEAVDMGDSEITSICDGAFSIYTGMDPTTESVFPKIKSVTFPSTLKYIGHCAFMNTALVNENLELPEGLEEIQDNAFRNTKISGTLKLPASLKKIGQGAFYNTKLEYIEFNNIERLRIGGSAFSSTNIKNITLSNKIDYSVYYTNPPGPNALFRDCNLLETAVVPGDGVSYDRFSNPTENALPEQFFYECKSLKTVYIQEGLKVIQSQALDNCVSLEDIYIFSTDLTTLNEVNSTYQSIDMSNNPTFHILKDSTTEKTLRNAGYLTDDNYVYLADTTELEKAIADGEAVDLANYTDDSVKSLEDAITAAKAVKENADASQNDVDNAVKSITDAIKALAYKPADYSAVEAAKAKVPADLSVYTDVTAKAVTDAVAAVVDGKNITEQETVDAWAKAIEDAVSGLEIKPTGGNVSGTIFVSDKNAETEMTVKAVASDGTETSVTETSMGTYTLEDLPVGDYTLTISGGKYVERTYEITVEVGELAQDVELNPYGDINGDGKVTTADVGMANSHAKGVKVLEGYKFDCADVKTDGVVSTADVGMINSHAKSVKSLW